MVLGKRLRDIFLNKLGLLVAATLLVAGCSGGGGGEGAAGGISNAVTLNSISINPASATVTKGLNTSFTANGIFGDGSVVGMVMILREHRET